MPVVLAPLAHESGENRGKYRLLEPVRKERAYQELLVALELPHDEFSPH
jgi:hypothetical protein